MLRANRRGDDLYGVERGKSRAESRFHTKKLKQNSEELKKKVGGREFSVLVLLTLERQGGTTCRS